MKLPEYTHDCLVRAQTYQAETAECIGILLAFIQQTPRDQLQFLTHQTFKNVLGRPTDSYGVGAALDLFCIHGVLERRFTFDDGTYSGEVESTEIDSAQETGYLVHPETGDEIKNYQSFVNVYWAVPEKFSSNSIGT